MKVIKRGNLAILSLSFMLIIAGYINYKYDPKREENLGKTVLVDSTENQYVYNGNENIDVYTEVGLNGETLYKRKSSSTISEVKSSRENMYSELEATYKESIQTSNLNEDKVKVYEEKIEDLIKEKHKINILETMLYAKGISDVAITKSEDKITVIVGKSTKDEQIAMIKTMVQEEFNIDAKDIIVNLVKE